MYGTCYLIGVIGAGDQQEDPGEWILGWIRDLPGLGAWMKVGNNVFFSDFPGHVFRSFD